MKKIDMRFSAEDVGEQLNPAYLTSYFPQYIKRYGMRRIKAVLRIITPLEKMLLR